MTVTGIIAEFNPFHNGHHYLLTQAEGVKIVAMSGNFTQRGEPALIDKWVRTQMALESGADLVVELPFLVSVQSADYFASGAMAILSQLGIEQLVFGTEESVDYENCKRIYQAQSVAMEAYLRELPQHLSYPQKTQLMWERFTGLSFTGQTPNHILALAYAKAAAHKQITLSPIKRLGSGFHSLEKDTEIASATALRHHLDDHDFIHKMTPHADLLLASPHVSWDNYFNLLAYQLLTAPHLSQILQVNQELAARLKAAIKDAQHVEDLLEKVATKRYTKARVRRLLTYILVQASQEQLPKGIRVLGFSSVGRRHLSNLKSSVSLVTRIGKQPWDEISQRADQIYCLGHPKLKEQNWGRIVLKKE